MCGQALGCFGEQEGEWGEVRGLEKCLQAICEVLEVILPHFVAEFFAQFLGHGREAAMEVDVVKIASRGGDSPWLEGAFRVVHAWRLRGCRGPCCRGVGRGRHNCMRC